MSLQPHTSLQHSRRPAALASTLASAEPEEVICPPFELHVRELLAEAHIDVVLVLEQPCSVCWGAAFVPVTVTRLCSSCTGSGRELAGDREQPCSVCEGTCCVPAEEMEQCDRCDGTGLELTAAGRRLVHRTAPELLAFLNRWRGWRTQT